MLGAVKPSLKASLNVSFKAPITTWLALVLTAVLAWASAWGSAWATAPVPAATAIVTATPRPGEAALTLLTACVQPEGAADCRPVAAVLPFHWDIDHAATPGTARFLFGFDRVPGAAAQALLLPRLGNGFALRLNGQPLAARGADARQQHDTSKRPWLLPLPEPLLQPQGNRLEVTIHAADGRAAQLHAPRVGEHALLQAEHDRIALWRVELTRVLMWMAALMGLMAALVWAVQREPVFIAVAVAEISWSLRLAEMFWIDMPLPWQAWGTLVAANFAVMQLALVWVFLNAVGQWRGWLKRAWLGYVLAWCVVVPLVVLLRWRDGWVGWIVGTTLMYTVLAAWIGWLSWRQRQPWRWLFIAWVMCSIAAGLADVAESPGAMYMHPTWSRLVMAVFSLGLAGLVALQLRRAREAEQAQTEVLRAALAAQAQELQAAHAAAERSALERAMLAERARLMRDMHDGLGGQLSALLTLTQRPEPPRAELQSQLRDAIDELRSVIDALQAYEGDLATLLGTLRPQLERRLAGAGVTLQWAVEALPEPGLLGPAALQHLRRLLLEAVTNVARHAGASTLTLAARPDADGRGVVIELTDDGRGFDPGAGQAAPASAATGGSTAHHGHGLANMRWRADALGGRLEWLHGTGSTLRLWLPGAAPAAPGPAATPSAPTLPAPPSAG